MKKSIIIILLLLIGCFSSESEEDPNTYPKITSVKFYPGSSLITSYVYNVGDTVRVEYIVNDPDKNVNKLYITIFKNSTIVESNNYNITQPYENTLYTSYVYPTVSGTYTACFEVTDSQGNLSPPYYVFYQVL